MLYIAFHDALVAQLDRATGYEPVGQEFESLRAHHNKNKRLAVTSWPLFLLSFAFFWPRVRTSREAWLIRMRIRQPVRNRNDDKQGCGEDSRRQGLFRLVGVTSSRQPKFRVLFPIIDRKQAGSEIARAWEILKYPPRPCCLGQSLATISTSKRCRAPFASFVTAHTGNLLPFCCQYARKLLPIAPRTYSDPRRRTRAGWSQNGRKAKKNGTPFLPVSH